MFPTFSADRSSTIPRSNTIPVTNTGVAECLLVQQVHEPGGPFEIWGAPVSFSSRWRYEAGASRLSALRRAGVPIGVAQMRGLLQTVAAGMTEHSVVVNLNTLEFEVAFCAAGEGDAPAEGGGDGVGWMWDAPYGRWHKLSFEDCFLVETNASRL